MVEKTYEKPTAERILRNIRVLRRINVVTLCVAIAVYIWLIGVVVFEQVLPLAVFSSSVMLAEVLVFHFVRTVCDYYESRQTS